MQYIRVQHKETGRTIFFVNHHGTLQNGHYTSFVQSGDQWFRCDDETITMATISEVLNTEAYMLFYVKKRLQYVPE